MPFAAILSSKVDNRILCGFGLTMFGISCLMNAYMDASTGYDQLFWSQIVRAAGQPFIMLTLSSFAMHGIAPKDTASASSLFNMTRNLGGSVGIAMLATTLTNREHFHSAIIGQSVSSFSAATQQRLDQLTAAFIGNGIDPATAAQQAIGVIDRVVRRESYVMAYNDGFVIMAVFLFACVGALLFADKVKAPSGPGAGAH
jgi:DHA2 family multidrug resistance protein